MWCSDCRQNGWTESREYPGVCIRCAPARKAARVAELEAAAPNNGQSCGWKDGEDHTFVFFPSLADAQAAYARDGASVGPRASTTRPGQWYLTYEK